MIDLAARSFVPSSSKEPLAKENKPALERREGGWIGSGNKPRSEDTSRKKSSMDEASRKDVSSERNRRTSSDRSDESDFKSRLDRVSEEKDSKSVSEVEAKQEKGVSERVEPTKVGKTDAMNSVDLLALQKGLRQMKETKERSPILEFMDSMESEFGIEPDRLIEAFGNLDNQQLLMAPEMSASAYIENLNIAPEDQGRANELYSKLLSDIRWQRDGSSQGAESLAPTEIQNLLSEMKPVKQEKLSRSEALEALNRKFFDVYPNQFGRPIDEQMQGMNKAFALQENTALNFNDKALVAKNSIEIQDNVSQEEGSSESLKTVLMGLSAAKLASEASQNPADQTLNLAQDSSVEDAPDSLQAMLEKAELVEADFSDSIESYESDGDSFLSEGDLSQDGSSEGAAKTNPFATGKTNQDNFAKLTSVAAANQAGAETQRGEATDLVKNVQYLAKQGGGEMKVQLNHESMGEVHLKVAMNEGKVDIQVLTESKEAKKLLESELSHLKMDLNEKKIELNEIKVDVAKDMRGMLQDQLSDQKRQETMKFWKQFKEENEAVRSMQANMGLSSYKQSRPNSISNPSASSYRTRDLNSRLDVVA